MSGPEDVTVETASVVPGAVRARALTLRPGDTVFDVFGGRHVLVRVNVTSRGVRTVREDGVRDVFAPLEDVTRIPGGVS